MIVGAWYWPLARDAIADNVNLGLILTRLPTGTVALKPTPVPHSVSHHHFRAHSHRETVR